MAVGVGVTRVDALDEAAVVVAVLRSARSRRGQAVDACRSFPGLRPAAL